MVYTYEVDTSFFRGGHFRMIQKWQIEYFVFCLFSREKKSA